MEAKKIKFISAIFIISLTLSAFGQVSSKLVDFNSMTCYKGKSFNVIVYLRANDSVAVMDWFYEEGVPRCFFSDTLLRHIANDTIWKSSISKIYLRKKQLYLQTTSSPYEPNQGMRLKLKFQEIGN